MKERNETQLKTNQEGPEKEEENVKNTEHGRQYKTVFR